MAKATTRGKSRPSKKPLRRHRHKEPSPRRRRVKRSATRSWRSFADPAGFRSAPWLRPTGWQEHSVQGFLAGTVRKKLGLNLESEKGEGDRIYRVTSAAPTKAA